MLDNEDSLMASMVKVQIDSSRDTMAFFRKVHQINRFSLDRIPLPHAVVHIGTLVAIGIGIWVLWSLLRPIVGPLLGLGPAPGVPYSQAGRLNPISSLGVARKDGIASGSKTSRSPQVGKSGLKVSKRPKPRKDSGPSLPRW